MEYFLGPYVARDLKRLKKIHSLEEDLKNHFTIFRGRVSERITSEYQVPLAQAMLHKEDLGEGIVVYFYKDRSAITNPKMSPAEGLRIIFGLYIKDRKPIKYVPFIVFTAKEEGKDYYAPNGKEYPLRSSSFRQIIVAKLEHIDPE